VIAFEVLAQSDASQQTIEDALGVVQTIVGYAGTIAFAISAALLAGRRKMNVVGAMVFGVIVATGGGTLRDVLLGRLPVYWVDDPTALIVAAVAAVVTIPLFKIGTISVMARYDVMRVADSAGLALFAVSGTNIALDSGAGSVSAVVVGVLAGVGGGIIRDVVAQRIPLVLSSGRLYASVAVLGCALDVALLELLSSRVVASAIAVGFIFGVRLLAIHFGWGAPTFAIDAKDVDGGELGAAGPRAD
jgi:uncharacterized membrane protein YeiH